MIGLPSSVRIFVAIEPADMRRGFDGLAHQVRVLGHSEYSGHLYVFISRRKDRCKILWWERGGLVLWAKRLEKGRFSLPYDAPCGGVVGVDPTQLAMLLDGIDLSRIERPARWEPVRRPTAM